MEGRKGRKKGGNLSLVVKQGCISWAPIENEDPEIDSIESISSIAQVKRRTGLVARVDVIFERGELVKRGKGASSS